jgi:hypothetical protein
MPVDLSNLLSLDAQEREVSIPVGSETVHVTIRELPYGKAVAVRLAYASAYQAWQEAGVLSSASAEAIAGALTALYQAQCEVVRWGVTGHREEDFLLGGLPVPFESSVATFNGATYPTASPRMLRLYLLAGGGRPGDPGTLIPALAEAVLAAQRPAPEGDAAGPLPSANG